MIISEALPRVFRTDGRKLMLPATVKVRFHLSPEALFGDSEMPAGLRSVVLRREPDGRQVGGKLEVDFHAGRQWATSADRLAPVLVEVVAPWGVFNVSGAVVECSFQCDSPEFAEARIAEVYHRLPHLLSADSADPITVKRVEGDVAGTPFWWIPRPAWALVAPIDVEGQRQRIARAITSLWEGPTSELRRLRAASAYLQTARRLIARSETPGEFYAEAVLNFAKILEVAFGEKNDDARRGLGRLGYTSEEIEWRFIPMAILRDELGVAHPKLSALSKESATTLILYIEQMEYAFQELVKRLMATPAAMRKDGRESDGREPKAERTLRKLEVNRRLWEQKNPPAPPLVQPLLPGVIPRPGT